jgi:hypothetical protein
MSYNSNSSDKKDYIKVILQSESWRFVSRKAHIGLHNKRGDGSSRQYTLKLTELKEIDILPPEIRDRFLVFDNLFKRNDAS